LQQAVQAHHFYHTMLCQCSICCRRVSVHLSTLSQVGVLPKWLNKHKRSGTLDFWRQRTWRKFNVLSSNRSAKQWWSRWKRQFL